MYHSLPPSFSPPPPPPHYHQEYFQTVLEFLKLEKVEFGGVKGRCLSEMVAQIFNEFQELMNKIGSSTYDPLDLSSKVPALVGMVSHFRVFPSTTLPQLIHVKWLLELWPMVQLWPLTIHSLPCDEHSVTTADKLCVKPPIWGRGTLCSKFPPFFCSLISLLLSCIIHLQ